MESNLFELLRLYPGECRYGGQHLVTPSFEFSKTKIDAAEVSVVGQVNEMAMSYGRDI